MEAAEKASNGNVAERGMATGRGSTEFTAFVSNLPFNVTVDELREKFKHVSYSMYMSLLPSQYVIVTLSVC